MQRVNKKHNHNFTHKNLKLKVCLSSYEEIYLNAKISGEQSSGSYHPSFSSIGVGLGTHPGSHHQPVFIRQVIVNGGSHHSLKLKSKLNKSY